MLATPAHGAGTGSHDSAVSGRGKIDFLLVDALSAPLNLTKKDFHLVIPLGNKDPPFTLIIQATGKGGAIKKLADFSKGQVIRHSRVLNAGKNRRSGILKISIRYFNDSFLAFQLSVLCTTVVNMVLSCIIAD